MANDVETFVARGERLFFVLVLLASPAAAQTSESEPDATTPAATTPEAPPPDAAPPALLDLLTARVFVDTYVASDWTLPDGFHGDHAADLPERVYDVAGGPNLSLAALDLAVEPAPVGGRLSLRFGSGEARWLGTTSGLPQGMQFIHEAFVSLRPSSELRIDFGELVTPYGAEVAETWMNVAYTLGSLFQLVQPFFHTGLRVVWQPVPWLSLTALAVGGYNTIVDNNDGKTGGLQATIDLEPVVLTFGYLGGPEQAPTAGVAGADGRMRHLVDAALWIDVAPVRLVLNADYRTEDMGGSWTTLFGTTQSSAPGSPQYQTLWGASVAASVTIVPELAIGGRAEYVGQPDIDVRDGRDLVTATLTLDLRPLDHVVLRLDTRVDWLSGPLFANQAGDHTSQTVVSSVLGLVVHSD